MIGPELAKAVADAFPRETFDPPAARLANVEAMNQVDARYSRR